MQSRESPAGYRLPQSIPIDLYGLLIAWAKNTFKQRRLLGWTMRVIENMLVNPTLCRSHSLMHTRWMLKGRPQARHAREHLS
jgi:hypothetical protein